MDKEKTYDAFLSYNSKDKEMVKKIEAWLRVEAKLKLWLDQRNLKPGDSFIEKIQETLKQSECFVFFWGQGGMGKWQEAELNAAYTKRVNDKSIRIVPVLLPGAAQPIPLFLREITSVGFKTCDDQNALHRLAIVIKNIEPKDGKPSPWKDKCPYRGLEVFEEKHKDIFFGRDNLINRLMDKFNESSFLAVVGPSGCGKSSVVQAGLIPKMRENSLVALFVPKENPLDELAYAIRRCYPEDKRPPGDELVNYLKNSEQKIYYIARNLLEDNNDKDKNNFVIVIDQFEELFSPSILEEIRKEFITTVLSSLNPGNSPIKVIITIRSDFLGKCAFYADLNKFINNNLVEVGAMSQDELRQAIEEPAQQVNLGFEKGLVTRILKDVKGAPSELPLLAHALLELYKRCKGKSSQITFVDYEEVGRIAEALVKRAESEYNELDKLSKEILRKIFVLRLIQPGEGTGDTSRRASKDEILAVGGNPQVVENLLEQWQKARLLTCTPDSLRKKDMVDVAHEALIRKWDRIQAWLLAFYKKIGAPIGEGNIFRMKGNIYFQLGEISEALKMYNEALFFYEKVGEPIGQGSAYLKKGEIFSSTGDNSRAFKMYDKALYFFNLAGSPIGQGNVYHIKGEAYQNMGNSSKALEMYYKALPFFKKSSEPIGQGNVYRGIGDIYFSIGDYSNAQNMYEKAMLFYEKASDIIGLGDIYRRLGGIYFFTGSISNAQKMYKKAMELFEKTGYPTGQGNVLLRQGDIHFYLGDYSSALKLYDRALVLFEKTGVLIYRGHGYRSKGNVYLKTGDFKRALEMYNKALTIYIKVGDIQSEGYTLQAKANISRKMGDKDEALILFERGISKLEKVRRHITLSQMRRSFMEKIYDQYEEATVFMLENKFYEKGFKYAELMKSRAFLDRIAEGLVPLDKGIPIKLKQKRDDLVSVLSFLSNEMANASDKKDENKLDKEEALRRAKLDLMKSKEYSSPFYWSAFVMYGE